MPQDDPTQPWLPPRPPTPQPKTRLQWLALIIKTAWRLRRQRKALKRVPRCKRCGGRLEIVGFESSGAHNPVWACPQCN